PAAEKRLLQVAAVIGRVFWRGALERLVAEPSIDPGLVALCDRDLIGIVERSTIPGDRAYQFQHVLIRDVAYAGMTKAERAEHHRHFAEWIGERESDELVEMTAHHLDQAAALHEELEGHVPAELASAAGAALQQAGRQALRRDSFAAARRLFRRSFELAPAAWWPGDLQLAERYTRDAINVAREADRQDLWVRAMGALQWLLELRLELDAAEDVLRSTGEHCGEGVLAEARSHFALGSLRRMQGRLTEARAELEQARGLYLDAGAAGDAAWAGLILGWISLVEGDAATAERGFRHAVRVYVTNEDRGHLCEAERALAEVLLETGRLDEAERHALAANSHV